jgi:hypothetical protein
MTNIELKGSCVTRESFNYSNTFKVSKYIFQKPLKVLTSPQTALRDENEIISNIKLALSNNESVRDFVIKQVDSSFTKRFVNGDADFFLFDLIDEWMPILKIRDSYVERRPEIEDALTESGIDYENESGNSDDVYGYIDKFITEINQHYEFKKIILHKAFAQFKVSDGAEFFPLSNTYVDDTHNKHSARRAVETNLYLHSLYEYIETKYPEINVIELKHKDYFSTHDHAYGRGYYHYNNQYYIDFLDELKVITNGVERDHEKQMMIANDNLHLFKLQQTVVDSTSGFETDRRLLLTEVPDNEPEDVLFHDSAGNSIAKLYYPNKARRGYMFYINKRIVVKVVIKDGNNYIYTRNEEGKFAAALSWSSRGFRLLRDNNHYIEKSNEVTILINKIHKVKVLIRNGSTSVLLYNFNTLFARHDFDQDFLHTSKLFSSNGKLSEALYAKGYKRAGRISSLFKYDETGNIEAKIELYLNGSIYTKLEYNPDGSYFRKIFYRRSTPERAVLYHLNKQTKRFIYYTDGTSLQQEVDFFEDGMRSKVTFFNEDGHIQKILTRDNSQKLLKKLDVELQHN